MMGKKIEFWEIMVLHGNSFALGSTCSKIFSTSFPYVLFFSLLFQVSLPHCQHAFSYLTSINSKLGMFMNHFMLEVL